MIITKEQLQPIIDCMNEEERKYLSFVYGKLQQAEEKHNHIVEIYKNIEAEVQANQNAIEVWLSYIQNKYQESEGEKEPNISESKENEF